MKNYQYKHYDKNFNFIKVINPNIIKSEVYFSENINWIQWECNILLKTKWDDLDFEEGDFITISATNKYFPNWYIIYTWYIEEIRKNASLFEEVILACVWIGALLNKVIFKRWSQFVFVPNDTPNNILNEIIDCFNDEYNWLIKKWTIDVATETVRTRFDYRTCFDAIQRIVDFVSNDYFWFIDRTWTFHFKNKNNVISHRVNFQKELQGLEQNKELNITNKLYVVYTWWVGVYEDTASINKYWLFENVIRDASIEDLASADELWNNYIAKYKEPQIETILKINNQYEFIEFAKWDDLASWDDTEIWLEILEENNFEWIEIWDKIRVQNIKNTITWNIVKKIYNRDVLETYLWEFDNFISLIKEDNG
jgi:hypothetical protein